MSAAMGVRWVVPAAQQTALEEFALPEPGPGEALVRTEASLVSAGTELAIYTGIHQGLTDLNARWPKFPQAMGYMAVTRVERVGPRVESCRPGDRLLTSTGHASHALLPASGDAALRFWRLPEDAPAHRLVLARMAKTAMTALVHAEVTVAQSVIIVGLGIIGQMALRLFTVAGAWPVVGADPIGFRRAAALRGGATAAISPDAGGAREQSRALLPEGADIVVDATGWASALPGAMALARDGGTVIVLGSPRGRAAEVDFYSDLHRRSLRVIGAHDSGIGSRPRERFPWTDSRVVPALVEWVRNGRLPVEDLVSHRVPPERLPEMYEGLLNEKERFLGVVLEWV